jgi:uncharacterized membrane protein
MKSSGAIQRKFTRTQRPAWSNRFAAPALAALLHALRPSHAGPFRHARERLLAIPGMREGIAWQGVWRWTLVYSHPSFGGGAWAFLIPDPGRPLLAVPVAEAALPHLPEKHLTRAVKDGLVMAPLVGAVRWATWEVTSKTLVENVLGIAASRAGATELANGATHTPAAARRAS